MNEEDEVYSLGNFTSEPSERHPILLSLFFRFFILLFAIYILIDVFSIQVVHGSTYRYLAQVNTIYTIPVIAPRGIIYDRNSNILAYNTSVYSIYLKVSQIPYSNRSNIFNDLSKITGLSTSDIYSVYSSAVNDGEGETVILQRLSQEQMVKALLSNYSQYYDVISTTIRVYPDGKPMSSILGFVGEPTQNDLNTYPYLNQNDEIGKDGIEMYYDKYLRGVDGQEVIEVNSLGDTVKVLSVEAPIPGDNIYLSIDTSLQNFVYNDIKGGIQEFNATGGAAVVQNPNDGSILAMVTSPTYDNNIFSSSDASNQYLSLLSDNRDPLINRAIAEAQPPGSTMKMVTSSAALQGGYVNTDYYFEDKGTFPLGGYVFQNYDKIGWGRINIIGAIRWSSNDFFYNLAANFLPFNVYVQYAQMYRLGRQTGIDLPGEASGEISTPTVKMQITGQPWYEGDALNAVIGQGYSLVTPIQLDDIVSTVANNGTYFVPHLLEKITNPQNNLLNYYKSSYYFQDKVSYNNYQIIKTGMNEAYLDGIDSTARTNIVDAGVKTGTAEYGPIINGSYEYAHAWTTGFAPYNNPSIAFVFFLQRGGLSVSTDIVTRNFLNWYFKKQ